ncbi:putative hydrolase or acyltransferase of alpha/beta superfamily [Xenococcus sp. PCC 7305]|uniref:alpha/beta fold hydrolase n=1 Tax=Xenococcus sp. PCC 7305 TaxID=102125 RepID=UPI0002AC901E|nr:alpha/beta hydrolase [Xenococcus sp. PCC 7305]ELS04393.1 putative hydrolase or acyltransferase of alpha/beta superfamily [Xenococcus sp. PCC 7305]
MPISEKCLRFLKPNEPKLTSPLFIYLPGMDGTGRLLRSQLPGLTKFFDIRCLSIPLDDLSDWAALVEQTAALIRAERKLAPSRPVYICGESFGGCLALKLAAYSRDLFDRMILMNPASTLSNQPIVGWGSTLVPLLPTPLYKMSAIGLLPFLIATERVSPQNQNALLTAMQSVTARTAAWRISLLSSFNLDEMPLHKISQPVLIIASEADRILPSATEADRLTGCLLNARKVLLSKSGHACLLEREMRLADILYSQEFVGQAALKSENFISN